MSNIRVSNHLGGAIVACAEHVDGQRKFLVGGTVEEPTDAPCPMCEQEQSRREHPARVRAALVSPNLSHTRARNHCGPAVCIYHRDDSSPSGVMLAEMCPADMFDPIFAELRAAGALSASAFPLSPTEGR